MTSHPVHAVNGRQMSLTCALVLDTNILLDSLPLVSGLHDHAELLPSREFAMIIPWIVLQELDLIKTRDKHGEALLTRQAQSAIDFLYTCFHNDDPLVRGQRTDETMMADGSRQNNDDDILGCILYFRKYFTRRVVLWSNDRNLVIKTSVHGIRSISFWKKDSKALYEEIQEIAKEGALSREMDWEPSVSIAQDVPVAVSEHSPHRLPGESAQIAANAVERLLGHFVRQKFETLIGEEWEGLIERPLPWSAADVLWLMERHWISVFSACLPASAKQNITRCWTQFERLQTGCLLGQASTNQLISDLEHLFLICGLEISWIGSCRNPSSK